MPLRNAEQVRGSSANVALWILAVVATLWFLREARGLFIPIALGALISYALEPAVNWLERRRLPRPASAGIVMLALLVLSAGGVYALREDVMQVVNTLPETIDRVRESVFAQLGSSQDTARRADTALANGGGAPVSLGSLAALAGHAVVVFFLVFFLLLSAHEVRDRLLVLAGPDRERQRTAAAIIRDINGQIQRYLVVLLITAIIVGAATWALLVWQGVPQAAVWGILAGIFNSIPYFGPMIVSGGLLVIGFSQGGGMNQALLLGGGALVITSIEGWLITPALMGKAERMSALAVFLGLVIWIWLWGEMGTILAVPMLAVIKAVADHVDRLKPLGRLLAR